jgi:hypothetical protein
MQIFCKMVVSRQFHEQRKSRKTADFGLFCRENTQNHGIFGMMLA